MCGVYCLLSTLQCCGGVCGVYGGSSVCRVALWCVVWNGGGGVWCVLSIFFSSSSFLSLCVGVRGSARAALRARTLSPNTIEFTLFLLLVPLLFSSTPRLSSFAAFSFVGMAVCAYHVSECSVGMTAMGSLSRSSSFFW